MRARLSQLLDALRTSFWFVPSTMLFLAAALALGLISIDDRYDPGMKRAVEWAYSGSPEGARSLLSTIAGSMITAASVTFSLASVALSIASQQYGSRVLRNFMRDRVTQVLLGTFVSTFLYSVLVVRVIRGSEYSGGFVPAIAITVAIALSLISLLMLVYFVHHVSSSIQASHIVATISKDLQASIPKLFVPSAAERADKAFDNPLLQAGETICLQESGYLQSIDTDDLMDLSVARDTMLVVTHKPGDHIVQGATVLMVPHRLSEKDEQRVREAFLVGAARTPTQDIRYQFQQLTDVICRALSPGINDPFTAINGIDELTTALTLIARRPRVAGLRKDGSGVVRLIVPSPDINELLTSTVGHIAIYAASDSFVIKRLHRVLEMVEPHLQEPAEFQTFHTLASDLQRRERAETGA